jgi:hypothetical protein
MLTTYTFGGHRVCTSELEKMRHLDKHSWWNLRPTTTWVGTDHGEQAAGEEILIPAGAREVAVNITDTGRGPFWS